MKKIFLSVVVMIVMCAGSVFAAENYLNAIILEGNEAGISNIVLRSDSIASVKRQIESPEKMTIEINGLKVSEDMSTVYRNTSSDNRIVVEQNDGNLLKIQIQGKNVTSANIIFDSPASAPVVVSDGISKKALGWGLFALIVVCFGFFKSRKLVADSEERIHSAVQKNIRDREVEMYRNYRRDLLAKPSIDYKISNPRIKRAIREADTIRHLQRLSRV